MKLIVAACVLLPAASGAAVVGCFRNVDGFQCPGGERRGQEQSRLEVLLTLGGLAARSCRRPVVRSRHVTITIPRRRGAVYRLADRIISSGEAAGRVLGTGP